MVTVRDAMWLCLVVAAAPRLARADDPAGPADPAEDGKTEVIDVVDRSPARQLVTGRAPVSVLTHDDLAASGRATLGDILQALPAQGNAGNAQSSAHGDGSTRINLRSLGAARTLVLINGRRVMNSGLGADASVDVNMIPAAMIERVEIIKDGASTQYGADAVGGVVNIVTRPQYDGIDVSLLTSTSQHGDGLEYDASAMTGFTSHDKNTYLVLSGGYQQHDPVFARDRGWSAYQDSYDFATHTVRHYLSPATSGGRLDVTALGAGATAPPGCTASVCTPLGNGAWANASDGDLYNQARDNYLYTPSTRWNVFATGGNRVNDTFSLFVEGLYMHRDSSRAYSPVPFDGDAVISKDSIYNPTGVDVTRFDRRLTEAGALRYSDVINTTRLVAGIRGDLPPSLGAAAGWPFEISFNWGNVASTTDSLGVFNTKYAKDALGPSMYDATGTPICVKVPGDASTKITYTNSLGSFDCVPLDLFAGAGKIPKDQLKNLSLDHTKSNGSDQQETLLATTGGKLVDLPNHGDIGLTVGAQYRHELGTYDPNSAAFTDYTSELLGRSTDYQFHVYDGYTELQVVPIADDAIAQRLEVDLGARYVNQHGFGQDLTYKLGALFKTVAGLSARATYATSWRTPSVAELQGGIFGIRALAEDPCDTAPPSTGGSPKTLDAAVQARCAAQGVPGDSRFATAQLSTFLGGNTALAPESAATASLGVVVEPPSLPGLAVTADYWHIAIDHAIQALGLQTILASCYEHGIQAFCDQITRDPTTHRITQVDQTLRNLPRTVTSGLDLAAWYDARLPAELGHLHSGLEAQYLLGYDLETGDQVIHGAGYYDLGAFPRWRANLSSRWTHPSGAAAGLSLRYVGSFLECTGNDCNTAAHRADAAHQVDRYAKLDVFAGYDVRTRAGLTSFQLGVNNAFDATPPAVYNAPEANSDAATYDFVGRVVFLRLAHQY